MMITTWVMIVTRMKSSVMRKAHTVYMMTHKSKLPTKTCSIGIIVK